MCKAIWTEMVKNRMSWELSRSSGQWALYNVLHSIQNELSNHIKTVGIVAELLRGSAGWQLHFMTAWGQDLTYSCQEKEMTHECVREGVKGYKWRAGKGWVSGDYQWLEILSHAISTVSLFIRLMPSWSYLTALRSEWERWREREKERNKEADCAQNKCRKEIGARKIRDNDKGLPASIIHCHTFRFHSNTYISQMLTTKGGNTIPNSYSHSIQNTW